MEAFDRIGSFWLLAGVLARQCTPCIVAGSRTCALSLSLSLSLVAHDPAEHPAPCTLHVQRAWRRVLGCARSRRAHARGCPASGVLVQAAQRCMCMSWNIRVMYECCQQCMHRHAARTRKTVCCTRKTVCEGTRRRSRASSSPGCWARDCLGYEGRPNTHSVTHGGIPRGR
jgi:hypothetical protein